MYSIFQLISQIYVEILQSKIPDNIFIDIGSNNGYTSYYTQNNKLKII